MTTPQSPRARTSRAENDRGAARRGALPARRGDAVDAASGGGRARRGAERDASVDERSRHSFREVRLDTSALAFSLGAEFCFFRRAVYCST